MKLFTSVGAIAFSYIGWYLAAPLGIGWAFVLSGIASLFGVYVGWKLGQRFL